MKTETALAVGEALFSHFSALQEIKEPLRAVWQIERLGCLDQVVLDFGAISLVVAAVVDDDSIDFRCVETTEIGMTDRVDASRHQCWNEFIGAPFGWLWVTVNQQGYCDGLLLSFGRGVVPEVAINIVASSIKLGRISMSAEHSSSCQQPVPL